MSRAPSSAEQDAAASRVSVMKSASQGLSFRAFRTFWSFVCVDSAEGPEPDSRESGATGLELTISSICRGIALPRVEWAGALGSSSYVVN